MLDELVFVGGCTTGLFIADPAAGGIRPTKDVHAIVDVTSYAKYAALSERLRALGLAEDTTPGAPLCWWRRDDLILDVMPVDERVLGFSNRWYPAAIERLSDSTWQDTMCEWSRPRSSSRPNSKRFMDAVAGLTAPMEGVMQ